MLKDLTPNLMVEDVNATIDWYTKTLDFEKIVSVPDDGDLNWAMLKSGDVSLMFQKRASLEEEVGVLVGKPIGASASLYIGVDDAIALHKKLAGKVTIAQELHKSFYGATEFGISDCNGYVLVFSSQAGDAAN